MSFLTFVDIVLFIITFVDKICNNSSLKGLKTTRPSYIEGELYILLTCVHQICFQQHSNPVKSPILFKVMGLFILVAFSFCHIHFPHGFALLCYNFRGKWQTTKEKHSEPECFFPLLPLGNGSRIFIAICWVTSIKLKYIASSVNMICAHDSTLLQLRHQSLSLLLFWLLGPKLSDVLKMLSQIHIPIVSLTIPFSI